MAKYPGPLETLIWEMRSVEAERIMGYSLRQFERYIGELWRHIEWLEELISFQSGLVTIKNGDTSIVLNKDGTILIKGNKISVEGGGRIDIKSGGDVVIKGARILQN